MEKIGDGGEGGKEGGGEWKSDGGVGAGEDGFGAIEFVTVELACVAFRILYQYGAGTTRAG